MTMGTVPHRAATPPFRKGGSPSFLDSSTSFFNPKRIEPLTWNWSQFEDILEENMVNFQDKGCGAPKGAPMDQKWQKLTNLEFFGFCHHPFHSGKKILLLLH